MDEESNNEINSEVLERYHRKGRASYPITELTKVNFIAVPLKSREYLKIFN